MKIKSMIAALAASAIAVSALAVTAFAEKKVTNGNDGDQMTYNVNQTDEKWGQIKGIKFTITPADGWTSTGFGAGVAYQGKGLSWTDWEINISGEGVADPAKNEIEFEKTGDNTFAFTLDTDTEWFKDIVDAEETWGQVCIQNWWGAEIAVDNVEFIYGEAPAAAETTTEAPADTTTAAATTTKAAAAVTTTKAADTKKTDSAKTGDAGVGVAVAALGLAAAAAFTARKKH